MSLLGGGFKYFLFSPRKLGKIPILTSIFFKGVGSTTDQIAFAGSVYLAQLYVINLIIDQRIFVGRNIGFERYVYIPKFTMKMN